MSETSTIGVSRHVLTLAAAAGLALAGTISITSAAQGAAPPKDHKVWVCKYVDKPGVAERLKAGKQPIYVDWHSLTGQSGPPQVGDTFSDAQGKSVVVQVGGSDPGRTACETKTPPPTTPPTTPTTPPTTPTTPPTKTHTPPPPHKTTNVPPPPTTPPAGGGGTETVPGTGAPGTGGDGGSTPVNALVGSGLLLGAAGLVGHDLATRRRRSAPHA
ncbi:hypothetical protein N865_08295 [Intrasporangium oryzae NRRL B-24470]|uniref:Gram-positive cocci surface proteins LPxTG domain-containing protein n=1 Tax=Intrasporangium oryzae NRRL B-24470 TaxID=1386089 RepID=W9G4Q4_9MICO|nr:hypothetical protein [Intrasporangium oryzae]EWS99787.1 hypothetical protein N865_08295 [Intrasporangium oryzae NRRL B-24470]